MQCTFKHSISIFSRCTNGSDVSAPSFAANLCILFHELITEIGNLISESCEEALEDNDIMYLTPEVANCKLLTSSLFFFKLKIFLCSGIYGQKVQKGVRLKGESTALSSTYDSIIGMQHQHAKHESSESLDGHPPKAKKAKKSKKALKNQFLGGPACLSQGDMGHMIECPACKTQVQSGIGRHRCLNDKNVENPCQ